MQAPYTENNLLDEFELLQKILPKVLHRLPHLLTMLKKSLMLSDTHCVFSFSAVNFLVNGH